MSGQGPIERPRHEERDRRSGRYTTTVRCDACGKPCGTAYYTDDDVCGATDGPGFYLCGRVRCGKLYDGLDVEARRALFTAQRTKNEEARR